ncbi:CBS domain-containing protein [Streptosporangium fragile]|uniref:CBS domain-containing protein n=1 Tax=Streptosporangium fragile TaxID=46186 RepID=A0ABN3W981_9ACTN
MDVTVKDIMTERVISVSEDTCFKKIAEALVAHGASSVPVLDGDGRVIGVVSEDDLLHKEEFRERFQGGGHRPPDRRGAEKAWGEVARDLMTTPAITIPVDASVVTAGRLMQEHGVKRLPVVDGHGRLMGIVSRHDVLKVFARPDRDIEREIRVNVLTRSLWMNTSRVAVAVENGVVTLSGRMVLRRDVELAVWMTRQVNGVVDVIDKLEWDRDNTPTGERR